MKKLLFLTAAAAIAFSSCTKDQTEVASIESKDGVRISASMGDETRTYLDGGYRWSKGDALGVFVKGGVNNAKNVAFTLDPAYDGQKTGEFVSSNEDLLDAANEQFFAYYPHTPGMYAEEILDLDLKVLPEQNYQPGSFSTLTAPAVSNIFTLDKCVTMQPVVDYVKVYINGVEDIDYLTLAIKYGDSWLNLTDVELADYVVDGETRYALVPAFDEGTPAETQGQPSTKPCDDPNHYYEWYGQTHHWAQGCSGYVTVPGAVTAVNPDSSIKLNCGRLEDTVVCHNENEYVFVIPAAILRSTSENAVVYIGVNYDIEDMDAADQGKHWFAFDMSANDTKSVGDAEAALEAGVSTTMLENTVHTLNNGVPVVYNPTNKFIIHNELDFLQYMKEYGTDGFGYRDAFVCGPMEDLRNNEVAADYEFNFTPEHMNELATSFKGEADEKEKLNKYVSDYIARGIPCIDTYKNVFMANGATFEAIKGLQSQKGMFGDLVENAKIENFTLKNIKGAAADAVEAEEAYAILASTIADGAAIENIAIDNASNANCILAAGDVDNVKEIEIVANEVLPYVIFDFSLEKDWTVVPESYLVDQLFVTTTAVNGHNVITVVESADAKATYAMFGDIDATRGDENCVSVVINNESWWTNDTIAPATSTIEYAEQLKYDATFEAISLARNMQMNDFDWEAAVKAATINGNGKTIYGITWSLKNKALLDLSTGVAPFTASTVKKLTIEGQTFNFVTDGTRKDYADAKVAMPTQIAGLTLSANVVEDVKINNFVIFAKDAADSEASLFDDVEPYYGETNIPNIGWAVVASTDGLFKNVEVNVTSSNVKGQAGLINTIALVNNAESQVINAKANVAAMEQSALEAIEAYDVEKHNNVAGTPVFKLVNNSGAARSIKFTECGAPALTYVSGANSEINVLNGNTLVGTF